jgi:hypothetical protein
MIRRFNYTGRKSIKRENAQIRLVQGGREASYFDADLRLESYSLPSSAEVLIEAYRQTVLMRFPWGTVGTLRPSVNRELTDFAAPEEALFRVRVVEADPRTGRLLAEADKIRPRDRETDEVRREPLLPVVPQDLRDEVWRIDFDDRPRLIINSNVVDWRSVAHSPEFRTLVYPAVLRTILTRILMIEKTIDTDDPSDWRCLWLKFAQQLPGAPERPADMEDQEETADWIESIVLAFARRERLLDRFLKATEGETSA